MNVLDELHARSSAAGLVPYTASTQTGYKKIEYRRPGKTKNNDPIYVAQIRGDRQSFKCKLYNLDKYAHLLDEINESTVQKLLASKECKGAEKGCTVGIDFEFRQKNYLLCRHLLFFRDLESGDIDSVWKLISAEMECRMQGKGSEFYDRR